MAGITDNGLNRYCCGRYQNRMPMRDLNQKRHNKKIKNIGKSINHTKTAKFRKNSFPPYLRFECDKFVTKKRANQCQKSRHDLRRSIGEVLDLKKRLQQKIQKAEYRKTEYRIPPPDDNKGDLSSIFLKKYLNHQN